MVIRLGTYAIISSFSLKRPPYVRDPAHLMAQGFLNAMILGIPMILIELEFDHFLLSVDCISYHDVGSQGDGKDCLNPTKKFRKRDSAQKNRMLLPSSGTKK
jgi:hypothetical protein